MNLSLLRQFFYLVSLSVFVNSALGQTCNTNIPPSTPSERFLLQDDGTVVDLKTNLMWAQCEEGHSGENCSLGNNTSFTWQAALLRAKISTFANYTDWRVPNINELESIVERQCVSPAINSTVFPRRRSTFYWSSTPDTDDPDDVWMVFMGFGSVTTNVRSAVFPVMLVRGNE